MSFFCRTGIQEKNVWPTAKGFYEFRSGNQVAGAGLGAANPSQADEDDDEFESYRKRMMLAYRFRPNPLVRFH